MLSIRARRAGGDVDCGNADANLSVSVTLQGLLSLGVLGWAGDLGGLCTVSV